VALAVDFRGGATVLVHGFVELLEHSLKTQQVYLVHELQRGNGDVCTPDVSLSIILHSEGAIVVLQRNKRIVHPILYRLQFLETTQSIRQI